MTPEEAWKDHIAPTLTTGGITFLRDQLQAFVEGKPCRLTTGMWVRDTPDGRCYCAVGAAMSPETEAFLDASDADAWIGKTIYERVPCPEDEYGPDPVITFTDWFDGYSGVDPVRTSLRERGATLLTWVNDVMEARCTSA